MILRVKNINLTSRQRNSGKFIPTRTLNKRSIFLQHPGIGKTTEHKKSRKLIIEGRIKFHKGKSIAFQKIFLTKNRNGRFLIGLIEKL